MAINVNTVYQTVLLILNKEQRGYMTPLEFNKIGGQSQLEIFETYFDTLNQQLRVPQPSADYADRVINLDEKISIFKDHGNATSISSSNVFNLPEQLGHNSGKASVIGMVTAPTATAGGTTQYAIGNNANGITVTSAQIQDGVVEVFGDGRLISPSEYNISGLNINFHSQPITGLTLLVNYYPKQFYRLGQVLFQVGALPTEELQRVDRGELYHLLSSNLTKPTTTNPIYTYENNQITVYPASITNGLSVSYIRKPIPPVWNYSSGSNNSYVFNASTSFNFELHPAEQTELILKILLYAGVVVKNPEIIQVAASQIQQENINQKS
tara:strand:- start:847 stop:1821 length:975 start_codon:yes stop_codon:yes gene_type:complete